MMSTGKRLSVAARTDEETAGTFQSLQFWRIKGKLGAFRRTEAGNVGNPRRPDATTLAVVSYGTHSPHETP